MPPTANKGMAGLLQDAGVNKAPTAPASGAATAIKAPVLPKGMAGILASAKPSTVASAPPIAVKSPFADVGTALTTQTDQTHKGIGGFFSSIGESFNGAVDEIGKNADEWASGGFLQKADALGKTMLLPVNVLFSPISAALQAVQGVPVVGQLADGLNRVFAAVGAGGADTANVALDALPISQDSKDAIRPLVNQLGAFAAQILIGKAGGHVLGKAGGVIDDATGGHLAGLKTTIAESPVGKASAKVKGVLGKEVIPSSLTALRKTPTVVPPEMREQVAATVKELGTRVVEAIQDPKTHEVMNQRHTAMGTEVKPSEGIFAKSAAHPEAKASIAKPAEMHPILRGEVRDAIQTHGPAATHSALINELGADHTTAEQLIKQAPVPQNAGEEVAAHQTALKGAVGGPEGLNADNSSVPKFGKAPAGAPEAKAPEVAPKAPEVAKKEEAPKPLQTEPGQSRVGKSIEAKAIEQKITKGFDKTAGYDVKTFKDAAEKTATLINSGIDKAMDVAHGKAERPEGVTSGALLAGIEEYAKANPEQAGDIMHQLANSKLVSETSVHAQETGSLRMREQDSATSRLQQIKKSLVEAAGGKDKIAKARASIVKGGRAALKAVTLSKEDASWDNFLNKIEC